MFLIIIYSYLCFVSSYNNFDLTSIRKALKSDQYPSYDIPSWAYKRAFNHNKKYNKITQKLKYTNQTQNEQQMLCKFYGIPYKYLD